MNLIYSNSKCRLMWSMNLINNILNNVLFLFLSLIIDVVMIRFSRSLIRQKRIFRFASTKRGNQVWRGIRIKPFFSECWEIWLIYFLKKRKQSEMLYSRWRFWIWRGKRPQLLSVFNFNKVKENDNLGNWNKDSSYYQSSLEKKI